jgi:hypothetical protein
MNVVLHPFQALVHSSDAKHRVIEGARRAGKSRVALWELITTIQEKMPESVSPHLQPPFHAWIVCPTYPQANQVWNELMAFVPANWQRKISEEYKRIELNGMPGGRAWGLIEVKSAHDPDSLQTAGLDFLWVTESQDIDNTAFDKLSPMLHSPDRNLRAIWEGIPSLWRDHWFWRQCDFAAKGHRNYEYFHWSCYDNPMLTAEQIEEIELERQVMTDAAWKRMYLAERSESAGFFKNIDDCAAGDLLAGPLPGARYVGGLDLGRKHDATVLWIMDADQRKGIYHQSWDAGEDWTQQREGIVHACDIFGLDRLNIDATGMGGDMFSQTLAEAGLPVEDFIFTEPTRMHLLNNLAVALERETVTYPAQQDLMRQFRAFQFIKRGNGKPRPDHPEGEHDDEIMAFGMALLLCEEAVPESPRHYRGGRMSYFPQNGDGGSLGRRLSREGIQRRREERWQRSGVVL